MKSNIPRNILSYTKNQTFSGKEIKEWISYHLKNKTSKSKIAEKLNPNLIEESEKYFLITEKRGLKLYLVTEANRFIF